MKSPLEWSSGDGLISRSLLVSPAAGGDTVPGAGDAERPAVAVAPASRCTVRTCVEQAPETLDLSNRRVTVWLAGAVRRETVSAGTAPDASVVKYDGACGNICAYSECSAEVEVGQADTEIDRLLERCLSSLHPGDRCRARLSLRTERVPGSWPADLVQLVCTVTLVSVLGGQHYETLTPAEMLSRAEQARLHGNRLFSGGRSVDAFCQYRQALSLLVYLPQSDDQDLQRRAADARVACRSNISACHLARGRCEAARDAASRVLQEQPDHLRCLYRRGAALLKLQDLERATADLQRVLQLQPGNRPAAEQMQALRSKQRQVDQHTAHYMTKFLGLGKK